MVRIDPRVSGGDQQGIVLAADALWWTDGRGDQVIRVGAPPVPSLPLVPAFTG